MQKFTVGQYVSAAWICNSAVRLVGRVEKVFSRYVIVRDSDGIAKRFNARDAGARFASWDDYILRAECGPVMVRQDTGVPVKRGAILEHESARFILSDLELPRHAASSGRVYVRKLGARDETAQGFFPHVFGLEWIQRNDRGETV